MAISTSVGDLRKAILKWRGYDSHSSLIGMDFYEFAAFIGHPHNPRDKSNHMIVNLNNPEVDRLIKLINGPNGTAILKMIKIRNEDKQNDR